MPSLVAVPEPSVDLTPLGGLVADLTRRNAELTEAATAWQFRAMRAEEQLKQLTAGESEQEAPAEAPPTAGAPEPTRATSDPSILSQRPWWRRALGI